MDRTRNEQAVPQAGGEYDVIVAGVGSAELGAAMAAARQGARTLLLEARSHFGGIAHLALWMPMNRLLTNGGPRSRQDDP